MQRLAQSIVSLFIAPIVVSCSGLLQQSRQLNMRIAANELYLRGEGIVAKSARRKC